MTLYSGLESLNSINTDVVAFLNTDSLNSCILFNDEMNNLLYGINEKIALVNNCINLYKEVDKYGSTEEFHTLLQTTGVTKQLGLVEADLTGSSLHRRDVYRDGIIDSIWNGIKWLINKIKSFFVWIYTKIREWVSGTRALNATNVKTTVDVIKDAPKNIPFEPDTVLYRYSDIKIQLLTLTKYIDELRKMYNYTVDLYNKKTTRTPTDFYNNVFYPSVQLYENIGLKITNTSDKDFINKNLTVVFTKTFNYITPALLGDQDWSAQAYEDMLRLLDNYDKISKDLSTVTKSQITVFDKMFNEIKNTNPNDNTILANIQNTTYAFHMISAGLAGGLSHFAYLNNCITLSRNVIIMTIDKYRRESGIDFIPLGK